MKGSLKKRYRDLEMEVLNRLREKILQSNYESSTVNAKAIRVDFDRYTEMTIINDQLTLLDGNGYHYSIFSGVSLEDLINILEPSN